MAVGTVSRVLNTPELVGPDVRQRVLEAIERINYRPLRRRVRKSARAAGQARRRGNVGVLLLGMDDSLAHLPVILEALHGVELAVGAANENLMLANLPAADRVPVFLSRNLVDGLILKSPLLGDFRANASSALVQAIESLPHVWLIGQPESAHGDVVACDNEVGGMIAGIRDPARRAARDSHPLSPCMPGASG